MWERMWVWYFVFFCFLFFLEDWGVVIDLFLLFGVVSIGGCFGILVGCGLLVLFFWILEFSFFDFWIFLIIMLYFWRVVFLKCCLRRLSICIFCLKDLGFFNRCLVMIVVNLLMKIFFVFRVEIKVLIIFLDLGCL